MSDLVATVVQLYFYPVKSMAGISVPEAHVGLDGILGDRQYAFTRADQAATNGFPWLTARQDARMLTYKPVLAQLPTPDQPEPPVRVRTAAGQLHAVDHPDLRDDLAAKSGHALFLLKCERGIFDNQHLSIFSLASLRALATQAGCAIDHRQFRANIYIEPASATAFEENNWTDSLLQIGGEVLAGVTQRDRRCMIIDLDPDTGNQNPRLLKTVVQNHQGQAGIYATVVSPGLIRVGDPIRRVLKHR